LEPINVKEWIEKQGITDADLKNETKEDTSFKLTIDLYQRQ